MLGKVSMIRARNFWRTLASDHFSDVSNSVKCFAGLVICFVFQASISAATYYVTPSGSDANPGSQAQPWRTIQKASDSMVAGDSVYVSPGNYAQVVTTKADGAKGMPIRYIAQGTVKTGGFKVTKAWQEVVGFDLDGTGVFGYDGVIEIFGGGNNFLARSNVVSTSVRNVYLVKALASPPTNCVFDGNRFLETYYQGVSLTGSGHLLTNNYFSSTNGGDAIRMLASNSSIVGNVFTNWSNLVGNDNHPDLIQTFAYGATDHSTNVLVEGNFFINCVGTQIGNIEDQARLGRVGWWTWRNNIWVNVEYVMSIYAHNFHFYNNVFYRTGRNSGHPLYFMDSTDRGMGHNGKVYNNIFIECGANPANAVQGWYAAGVVTNLQADHNLVVGTGAGTTKTGFQTANREMHGINGKSPMLYNLQVLDFRLQNGSPCIEAGLPLNHLFTLDFKGNYRGSTWDIGAYEAATASVSPLVPPKAIRIISHD